MACLDGGPSAAGVVYRDRIPGEIVDSASRPGSLFRPPILLIPRTSCGACKNSPKRQRAVRRLIAGRPALPFEAVVTT